MLYQLPSGNAPDVDVRPMHLSPRGRDALQQRHRGSAVHLVNRHVVSDKVTLADKWVVLGPVVVAQVIVDHGQDLCATFATLQACGVIDDVLRNRLMR